MLARWLLLGLFLPAHLAPAAAEDCGNSNACLDGQTCVSTAPHAGRRFGCAPTTDAVICNDARYSCPAGYACELEAEICRRGGWGEASPLLRNANASASPAMKGAPAKLCEVLMPDLPAMCGCTDAPLGGVVECELGVLFEDHFGLKASILPCDKVAHVDLQVTESKHGINYTIAGVSAGESKNIPIPGLTIGIPKVGQADVDASVEVDGSLADLGLKVGINACATVAGKRVCGSDLTGYLPFWIVNGSYHFGNICDPDRELLVV